MLEDAINQVYGAAYRRWRKDNPDLHYQLCVETATLLKFQKGERIENFVDAFLEARTLRKANPEALIEFEEAVDEGAAVALDRNPETEHLVRNLAFASWTPAMFPTLFNLQDEMHSASLQKAPHQELCATLASLLRPWLRDGRHGVLLDGAINLDLGSADISESEALKVLHFECV